MQWLEDCTVGSPAVEERQALRRLPWLPLALGAVAFLSVSPAASAGRRRLAAKAAGGYRHEISGWKEGCSLGVWLLGGIPVEAGEGTGLEGQRPLLGHHCRRACAALTTYYCSTGSPLGYLLEKWEGLIELRELSSFHLVAGQLCRGGCWRCLSASGKDGLGTVKATQ